jgi:hypothetical protein
MITNGWSEKLINMIRDNGAIHGDDGCSYIAFAAFDSLQLWTGRTPHGVGNWLEQHEFLPTYQAWMEFKLAGGADFNQGV